MLCVMGSWKKITRYLWIFFEWWHVNVLLNKWIFMPNKIKKNFCFDDRGSLNLWNMVNLYQSGWQYNPEDSHLCPHCCENLKSQKTLLHRMKRSEGKD
jgi:hypothetical protein